MVRRTWNLEPGTWNLELETGDSPMELGTNRGADVQPLQAHLRDKPAKEPYARKAVLPSRAPFELAQGWPRCEGGRQYVNVAGWHPAVRLLERQSRKRKYTKITDKVF